MEAKVQIQMIIGNNLLDKNYTYKIILQFNTFFLQFITLHFFTLSTTSKFVLQTYFKI